MEDIEKNTTETETEQEQEQEQVQDQNNAPADVPDNTDTETDKTVQETEFDTFIQQAEREYKQQQKQQYEQDTEEDSYSEIHVTQGQKILADTFVDLLNFVCDFLIGATVLKDFEDTHDYEPFTDKEKKHLSKVWGNLIAYYRLENLLSPALSASIVTVTCVMGAVRRAKKYKAEKLPQKKALPTQISNNQLTLFDHETARQQVEQPQKRGRGRPRKNTQTA